MIIPTLKRVREETHSYRQYNFWPTTARTWGYLCSMVESMLGYKFKALMYLTGHELILKGARPILRIVFNLNKEC